MKEDAQLLREFAEQHSESAFKELVERHLGLVYHAALRQLGDDASLAEDVAQSVFILLAEKARALQSHTRLVGWLYATTHLKVAETLRAERRRRVREDAAQLMQQIPNESSPEADWRKLRPLVDESLIALSEPDREAILLRFFEGHPFAEIGLRLGLNEKAAHKRVERALEKLRLQLVKRGITSTALALGTALSGHAAAGLPAGLAATVTASAMATPTASLAAISLFQLMSTAKATMCAAALVVSVIGVATYELYRWRQEATSVASLEASNANLRERVRLARLREALGQTDLRDRRERNARSQASPSIKPDAVTLKPDGTRDGKVFFQAHPELKSLVLSIGRRKTVAQYDAFFQAEGLSAEKIEQFKDLLFQGSTVRIGQFWVRVTDALETESTPLLPEQFQQEERRLLGEEEFAKWNEYAKSTTARGFVDKLEERLVFSEHSLSPIQREEVARIVRTHATSYSDTYSGPKSEAMWSDLIRFAEGHFDASQKVALNELQQQWIYDRSLRNAEKPILSAK